MQNRPCAGRSTEWRHQVPIANSCLPCCCLAYSLNHGDHRRQGRNKRERGHEISRSTNASGRMNGPLYFRRARTLPHTHHPTVSAHTLTEATSSLSSSSTQQHRGPFNTQTYAQPSRPDRPLTPCTNYSTHAPHRPLPHDRATNPLATCMQLDNYLIHALQDSATLPDAPLVTAAGLGC